MGKNYKIFTQPVAVKQPTFELPQSGVVAGYHALIHYILNNENLGESRKAALYQDALNKLLTNKKSLENTANFLYQLISQQITQTAPLKKKAMIIKIILHLPNRAILSR